MNLCPQTLEDNVQRHCVPTQSVGINQLGTQSQIKAEQKGVLNIKAQADGFSTTASGNSVPSGAKEMNRSTL